MGFLDQVKAVWPLVMQAPWGFAPIAFAILASGWAIGRFMYGQRIALLKERIDSYKEKLDGASPDEASARIAELERRLDEATHDSRLLKPEQLARMAMALRNRTSGEILVSRDTGSIETAKVQAQLVRFFKDLRWTVKNGTTFGVSNPPASGLILFSRTTDPHPSTDELSVAAALEAGGVSYELRRGAPHPKSAALQLNFSDAEDA